MTDDSWPQTERRTGKNPGPRTGLRSRQNARLRHVPVTRRVAAWIAAVAHDASTSRNFVIGFAAAHVVLWTIILTALKGAQDIPTEVAETYAWGRTFLLGYGQSPPLAGWVAGIWFRVFPATDWSAYALAMTVLGSGLLISWLIAIRVVDHRRAMFTVAMLALYPVFNLKGFRYSPDLLLLATLPLLVLAYLDAFGKRTWQAGLWLGLAGAAALMTSYLALVLIAAIAVAALAHPQRAAFLRSPAPWVALAVALVALLPHLWWLKQADFLPLSAVRDLRGAQPFAATLGLILTYLARNVWWLLLPVVLACVALAWKLQWWTSIRAKGVFREARESAVRPWVRGPNPGVYLAQARHVWIIQIVAAVVLPVVALLAGIPLNAEWGMSLLFLLPLALVAIPALRVTQMAMIRLMLMWLAFTLVMLVAAPIVAAQTVRRDGAPGASFLPRSEFALQLTEAWRARFNTRWAVVAASAEIGEPLTFYSPDHPAPLMPGDIWSPGLSNLEQATKLGFIAICDTRGAAAQQCEAAMNQIAPGGEKIDLTSRRYFHGKAGPAVRWKIWIVGPARTDDEN